MQPPIPIKLERPAWVREFQAFVTRGNVVDLAVGIIIGAAFTAIVSSLVKDIFTPIIGLLVGGIDFTNIFVVLSGERRPTLAATQQAGAATLNVGLFLNSVIQFMIVAFAIFWLVRVINRLSKKAAAEAPPPAPPAPTGEEKLLEEIRDILKARP